jgi:hypothetical protein
MFWRRYLKRCEGILCRNVIIDWMTRIVRTYLGFSLTGGKSFDIITPCMLKTASSFTRSPLFSRFNKRQDNGFVISWTTNLSEIVLIPCLGLACKSLMLCIKILCSPGINLPVRYCLLRVSRLRSVRVHCLFMAVSLVGRHSFELTCACMVVIFVEHFV